MTLDALKSDNLLTLKLATIKAKIWSAAATGLLQCETSQVSTEYFHKNEKQLGEKKNLSEQQKENDWKPTCRQNHYIQQRAQILQDKLQRNGNIEIIQFSPWLPLSTLQQVMQLWRLVIKLLTAGLQVYKIAAGTS